MILSYDKKFLFVKTHKTASTSAEIALSSICGDRDIITMITPIDEYLRLEIGRPFQNCLSDGTLEKKYLKVLKESRPRIIGIPHEIKIARKFSNHMSINKICAALPIELSNFFKFTIERHPYEKAVSIANFRLRYEAYKIGKPMHADINEIAIKIDQLIETGKLKKKIRNYDLYTMNGKVAVDKIIRFERLKEDFADVMKILGGNSQIELPTAKRGHRDRTIPAAELLTMAQKSWIQQICAEEFDLMNYSR